MMQNTLKAISSTSKELRVANYMVLFGGKDLHGQYFTHKTNFESDYTDMGVLYVDFEHGRDPDRVGNHADNLLGIVDWKTAKADARGLFVERVLNRRSQYVKYLEALIDAGLVGTSSQASRETFKVASSGEIIDWPLVRDSLTVTPAEPRMLGGNILTAAKALREAFPASKSLFTLFSQPSAEQLQRIAAGIRQRAR